MVLESLLTVNAMFKSSFVFEDMRVNLLFIYLLLETIKKQIFIREIERL